MDLDDKQLTLLVEPKIAICNVLTIVQDNVEVGTVDAMYDLSATPPALHGLVLQVLQASKNRLILPTARTEDVAIPPKKRSLWQMLKSIIEPGFPA